MVEAEPTTRERILAAARSVVQARGYGSGLSYRDLAAEVGIKAASVYHYFPSKADLGAAVAKRYWEDSAAVLDSLRADSADPAAALHRYPETFRAALQNGNRMCLSSFLAAESEDLPDAVKAEVQAFADVNVAWLSRVLQDASVVDGDDADVRARAIYAAVAGAQLIARSRSDVSVYDALIDGYRAAGLLPA